MKENLKENFKEKFKEYSTKVKDWWMPLSLREKQAVAIGGSVLALFILYEGIWSPYLNHIANLRERIVSDQKTLVWMQAADKELRKASGQVQARANINSPVVLLSLLQREIAQAGLDQSLTQLKQSSNDAVELHFQKVEFDRLIKLLTSVVKKQNVSIAQMAVKAEGTPGIVNADIVIRIG